MREDYVCMKIIVIHLERLKSSVDGDQKDQTVVDSLCLRTNNFHSLRRRRRRRMLRLSLTSLFNFYSILTPSAFILILVVGGSVSEISRRGKRGYDVDYPRGFSTGIAYNRLDDSGQVRSVGDRGKKGQRLPGVGEDGTHTRDFKSYGVGYEHRHSGHCEESKCGFHIRHCPHGCVFNSLQCGGGASYDTCCC